MPLTRALIQSKEFVLNAVIREFKARYINSSMGWLWAFMGPLALMGIYTIIFSQIMRARLGDVDNQYGYAIYICVGISVWTLFSEIVLRMQNVFIENANILKKIKVSKIALPSAVIITAMINHFFLFGILIAITIALGFWPGTNILGVIPVLVVILLFALGLGITLAVFNVFFRDVGQFFSIFIQFWFWGTPIVYPVSILPETIKNVMFYNPMYGIVASYQKIFVYHSWPSFSELWYPLAFAVCLCFFGLWTFRVFENDIVDEI